MRIAECNNFEPVEEHGPCPTDPLGAFLHGLLTMPDLFAAGGFRVADIATDNAPPAGTRDRWCRTRPGTAE
ncbi:hypothetical protein ACFY5H_18135 [Streptomyces sp. NPDC013012]|uniref:hypothetical protein n=1 Tax=Streptomyces sp. NPDC013012 TaxID=3364860 RepID=UPI0036A13463